MRMKLNKFLGLMPKESAENSPFGIAEEALDVDLSRQTLRPFNTPLKIAEGKGAALYADDCCIISVQNCKASFAKTGMDCDTIIAATGVENTPVFTNECPARWEQLGFDCALDAPMVAANAPLHTDFTMGMRSYYYTLINRMGWESMPSEPSYWQRHNVDAAARIGGFSITPNAVKIRIYRAQTPLDYGSDGGEQAEGHLDAAYLLVGEIDTQTAMFVDDVLVGGQACVSEAYAPPPRDLRELCSWREGRLAGLSGNHFVMSERNLPHAWHQKYRIGFYDRPIALKCVNRTAYVLTDGKPAVLELRGDCQENEAPIVVNELPFSLPIVSRRSAAIHGTAVVYAGMEGLVLLNGTDVSIITKELFTAEQWKMLEPHTMMGAVSGGYYYGITQRQSIRLRLPDNIYPALDATALTNLSLKPSALFTREDGALTMLLDDKARGYEGVYLWNEGEEKMPYLWRSRVIESNSLLRFSAYRLRTGANVRVRHFVDTKLLQDKSDTGNAATRLPIGRQGRTWQFEISGIGEVSQYQLGAGIAELSQDDGA